MNFNNLINNSNIVKALTENGITAPTEIQSKAIPIGLEGKDIIAKSQTGTGKTLAFMLPILENISDEKCVQALIICPTRELSMQVHNEIVKYIKYMDGINSVVVYGGQRIDEQIKKLRCKPQIIVATPGRLLDHFRRKTIKTFKIERVVLDEADEMISIGFKDELDAILEYLPNERKTALFSATFPSKVVHLTKTYLRDPITIKQDVLTQTIGTIEQFYLNINEGDKIEVLKRLIYTNPGLSIVFCNTKRKVDETVAILQSQGFISEALHGDLDQKQRDNVMKKMRSGILDVLVATDVAARGLDIKGVEAVYNFDFPDDFEYYVHRIGRTGRAGSTGVSYTFVTSRQQRRLKDLSRTIKADIKQIDIPSIKNVNALRIDKFLERLNFDNDVSTDIFNKLIEAGHSYEEIAKALINDKFDISDFNEITSRSKSRDKRQNERGGRNKGDNRDSRSSRGTRSRSNNNQDDVRLFISAGKRDSIKVKHIVGAFKNQSSIKDNEINDVEIMGEFSFVTIPSKHIGEISKIKRLKNIRVTVELANNGKGKKRRK